MKADIKDLAVCSNEMKFENINKATKTKKQAKKLRRLQRKVSRKYEMNKNGKEYVKTGNIIKLEKQIRLTHRKIANARLKHIHQATTALVKTKPSRIVMENLNEKLSASRVSTFSQLFLRINAPFMVLNLLRRIGFIHLQKHAVIADT